MIRRFVWIHGLGPDGRAQVERCVFGASMLSRKSWRRVSSVRGA